MTGYTKLDKCVCCGSSDLRLTLDLGKQPLANSYKLNKDDIQEEYPLAINTCKSCWHTQLTVAVDPDLMFRDYLYVSGTSQTGHKHFEWFANYVASVWAQNNKGYGAVLDVGCNDGTQLDYFKKIGFETYGVDPAENLTLIAAAKGHFIDCEYFNRKWVKSRGLFDIVTAQNVFAHTAEPLEFLRTAKDALIKDGLLFIQTSQCHMIQNNEFDTIYHEHISFFNVNSMNELCKRAGMTLVDVKRADIHGTSFIFVIQNGIHDNSELLAYETTGEKYQGLYREETYDFYAKNCMKVMRELKETLEGWTRNESFGYYAVGYGAAAKGMTLLNAAKIHLDFIIDDNPLKQGRFTPGMSIPIVSISELDKYENADIMFVPLAWNFFDEIRTRIKTKRDKEWDKFVTYFPKVTVE